MDLFILLFSLLLSSPSATAATANDDERVTAEQPTSPPVSDQPARSIYIHGTNKP